MRRGHAGDVMMNFTNGNMGYIWFRRLMTYLVGSGSVGNGDIILYDTYITGVTQLTQRD